MPVKIAGIILAGGQSVRMGGGDKCFHLLDDETVLTHVIRRMCPQVDTLVLNANGDPSRFSSHGLEVVADTFLNSGPLGGIHAGLTWASNRNPNVTHILTVAADTPFVPKDLSDKLGAAAQGTERIAMASSQGQVHPTAALWPTSLAADLKDFLAREGAQSVRAYAARHQPPLIIDFPVTDDLDPFFNINSPADLAMAQKHVRRYLT